VTSTDARPLRRDAADNRERLLQAAQTVFARSGLEAGVNEVAAEAGVGVGTLYRHFGAKDALLDALVGAFVDDVEQVVGSALDVPDGKGLETYLLGLGEVLLTHRACLPHLADSTVSARLDGVVPPLEALMADARAHGRVRDEITRADVTMVSWSLRAIITTTGSIAPRAWRRHVELLLAGLRPGPAFQTAPMTPAELSAAEELRRRCSRQVSEPGSAGTSTA
jgi:AcrR family transcriptional regulator